MTTTRHDPASTTGSPGPHAPIPPLRKAAILIVSLDQTMASQVLALLDREAVEAVTLEIAQLDRVSADEQQAVLGEFLDLGRRRLRFEFDNLAALGGQDVRSAYHDEDASTWAMALVGAPRPLRDHVLSALPASQATSLRRVIEGIGPFRLDDSEAAQNDLIERIRLLHDHGRLTLPDPSGQEEILA